MKMSDIFGYNYKMTYGIYTDARVDGMAMPANMGFGMLFTNEEAPKAVCHAVNNHDRLTEENAKLREFVEIISSAKVYTVEVSNPYGGTDDMDCLCDSLKDKAKQLLNQLEEQQNEQAKK